MGERTRNPSLPFFDGRVNNRAPSPGLLTLETSFASVNPQNGLRVFSA